MKNKSLIKNSIFNVCYKALNAIFPLITASYVSRVLLAEGIGKVAYAQNIVSYFVLIAALGIPSYGIREIAQAKNDKNKRDKTFSELFILNAISTSLCLLAYLITINTVPIFETRRQLHTVFAFMLAFNYLNVDWFYMGQEEYVYIAIRSFIVKLISVCMLFLLVKTVDDYIIYTYIICFATGGNYVFNVVHLKKHVKMSFTGLQLKRHLSAITILFASAVATELYSKIDITMLGPIGDTVTGYYSNAYRLINMSIQILTAITAIFLPRLSMYFALEKDKFYALVNQGLKIILFLGIPSFTGLFIVADSVVLVLFGNSFMPIVTTVRILSILLLAKGAGDLLCYQVLLSANKERYFIPAYAAAAVINIILNVILIPHFYQNGAAVASVASEVIVNASLLIVALKVTKVDIPIKFFISVSLSAAGMGVAAYTVNHMPIPDVMRLLLGITVGSITYFAIAYFSKNEVMAVISKKLIRKAF